MPSGHVALVLHAHLPFVKHPEHEDFLEEDWYFEAVSETYLPLLATMDRLISERVPFRLNLVVTPTLAAMMEDDHHKARAERYLRTRRELANREAQRLRAKTDFGPVAAFYRDRYDWLYRLFVEQYRCDLLGTLRRLQDTGVLEILTCAATHGLLPVLRDNPNAVEAQVAVGVQEYHRHFHKAPNGIWLPECGYFEGLEEVLARHEIRYFVVDTHCFTYAKPLPVRGVYAPVFTPSLVAAFARDPESSKQVWSAREGYPGDVFYREFYRDVGYDLPEHAIREFLLPTGHRRPTGLKYYRITGDVDLAEKRPYMPTVARERAAVHAGHFMFNRERQIEYWAERLDVPPIVVAPYDAELFGHWWFEGPDFLDFLFRKVAYDQHVFSFITLSEYLKRHDTHQIAIPATGSWGDKGYFEVWVNDLTAYMYPHLSHCAGRMKSLCERFRSPSPLERRALTQCAREVLLAQASDWAFIVTTGTMVEYAHNRFKDHVTRFLSLAAQLERGQVDEGFLSWLETCDSLFPDLDYMVFS